MGIKNRLLAVSLAAVLALGLLPGVQQAAAEETATVQLY